MCRLSLRRRFSGKTPINQCHKRIENVSTPRNKPTHLNINVHKQISFFPILISLSSNYRAEIDKLNLIFMIIIDFYRFWVMNTDESDDINQTLFAVCSSVSKTISPDSTPGVKRTRKGG